MLHLKSKSALFLRLGEIRNASAWIKPNAASSASEKVDVEQLFIDDDVQKLLTNLTEIDLENKVFRPRRTSIQQRSHFALMTNERLDKTRQQMREEARRFLQFVPVKEPRDESVQILSKDPELEAFDSSKLVFTDITFDATDQDRTVVVREPDGTLRTANPEEHDRMNRTYYQKPNRPVFPPPIFEDPYLKDAMEKNEHEFVLDWACWFYEPNDPAFVKLSHLIFDRVNEAQKFGVLTSTRHFGPFVFYLALNDNIVALLNYFGGLGRLTDCANLVRLQKTLHPNWRVTIAQSDSDEKIVKDFIKQNSRHRDNLADLSTFINTGATKEDKPLRKPERSRMFDKRQARITSKNVTGADGPLGDLSHEYSVKVVKSEGTGDAEAKRDEDRDREREDKEKPRGGSGGRWRQPRKDGSRNNKDKKGDDK